jgi:hypothetical protein
MALDFACCSDVPANDDLAKLSAYATACPQLARADVGRRDLM